MQRQPGRLACCVALCSIVAGGCTNLSNLRWGADDAPLGAGTSEAALSAGIGDPAAQAKSATTGAKGQAKNMLEGQLALARLSERRGEDDQAEQTYVALLEKAPRDARIYHRLGVLAMRKGDFPEAEKRLATARSMATPTAELLSDIGYCHYLQQKLPEAESVLREAVKLSPNCAIAINNLALVVGKQGRYQESLELFQRGNGEAEACANLGYVLAQNGETARAEQMYLRALTLDNTLKVAAQAMLQINERDHAQQKLASEDSRPSPAARVASHEDKAGGTITAAHKIEGRDVKIAAPDSLFE